MGTVDVGFGQIYFAFGEQVQRQGMQYLVENSPLVPAGKPAMAGRIWGVFARHLRPLRTGAQNPQHAVEYIARIAPRSAPLLAGPKLFRLGYVGFDDIPLLVGEVHRPIYKHILVRMERPL